MGCFFGMRRSSQGSRAAAFALIAQNALTRTVRSLHNSGMTLAEYIKASRGTAAELAKKLGVSHTTVYRWAAGTIEPSLKACSRIEEHTEGAVTVADLVAQAKRRVHGAKAAQHVAKKTVTKEQQK
ncbi:MAG: helix-turn-helix domain-containing protein [Erythrobacter sp.]